MKKTLLASLLTLGSVVGLSGCQMNSIDMSKLTADSTNSTYPKVESKVINTEVVNYKLVQGKKRQTNNKVSMTLEPVNISEGDIYHQARVTPMLTLLTVNNQKNYEVVYTPLLSQDDRLRFTLKVANSSSRVLRPSGAVLTFSVDGKSTSVKGENYQMLLDMMIVPNGNEEITINGPKLSELKKDKGVLAIDLYEVQVGDKLSNYSWVLQYDKKNATISTVVRKEKHSLTPSDARGINGKVVKLTPVETELTTTAEKG